MAKPYLTELETMIRRLSLFQDDNYNVSCKHFFSGAAAYVNGQIFMSLSPVGLALKLPDEDCALLFTQGALPLRYFSSSPVKKGYAVLSAHLAKDDASLMLWIERSVEFVRDGS